MALDERVLADRNEAWLRVLDPTTTAADLAAIAGRYVEFHPAISAHPQAYAALVDWIRSLSSPLVTGSAAQPVVSSALTESSPAGSRTSTGAIAQPSLDPLPTSPAAPAGSQAHATQEAAESAFTSHEWSHEAEVAPPAARGPLEAPATAQDEPEKWVRTKQAAEVTGTVLGGIGWLLTKFLGLVALGIGIFVISLGQGFGGFAIGALIAGYGIYLLFPGDKWLIFFG